MEPTLKEQEIIRRQKLDELKKMGRDPYFSKHKNSIEIPEIVKLYENFTKEELHEKETPLYDLAGRVMMVRDQGKAMFLAIKSNGLPFQFYVRKDAISEED